MGDRRANYTLLSFQEQLGTDPEHLDVPWAEFVGDHSSTLEFTVPTDDATEPYVELQAYDVDKWHHELRINGDELSGFDVPPTDGWQYWMDAITAADLREGTNTLDVRRDTSTRDSFVVGTAVVHWKEPVE